MTTEGDNMLGRTSILLTLVLITACAGTGKSPDKKPATATGIVSDNGAGAQPSSSLSGFGPGKIGPQLDLERALRGQIDASVCDEHLKELTQSPHVAGSKRNQELKHYLRNRLEGYGCQVEIFDYDVLLPYPREVQVEMVAPFAFSAELREQPVLVDLDTRSESITPYNAYSPDCDITAPVVYANYARREDFATLKSLGISLQGAIVIARYGHVFRGSKTALAEEYGAAALLLYSDPADDGYARGDVYPKGRFRPATAVERGSILRIFDYPGDPGTPGRASLPGTEQLTFDKMDSLPNLPTTCLSQADARPILENLGGAAVPRDWQGALPFTYHLGGRATVRVHLKLLMDYSLRRISNVVATIPGFRNSDEVVLVGNHRDAWVHGAIDPGSGTAVLLEAARVLAASKQEGRGLDRTLKFAFWDAEEFGMIGSTEWGEQFAQQLTQEVVTYVNVDAAVSGPDLRIAGVPSLKSFTTNLTRSLPGQATGTTRFDELTQGAKEMPYGTLGSGSDYTVFLEHLGIPCLDFSSNGSNGVYHSGFDTYVFMKRLGDPGFKEHGRMAQLLVTLLARLGRCEILPFDFARYEDSLMKSKQKMEAEHPQLDLAEIAELATKIGTIGRKINELRSVVDSKNLALETRILINKQMLAVEKALLIETGIPGRPWYRHVLFAPHPDKGYGSEDFPTINDPLRRDDRHGAQSGATILALRLREFGTRLEALEQTLERF